MGFLKNIKQGLDAARNPPSPQQIEESLKHLTPEQRAAYDANMAQVEQGMRESQEAWQQAAAINDAARILEGPAGRYLYGAGMSEFGSPEDLSARAAEVGVWELQKELRAKRKGEFRTVLRQSFNMDEVEQEEDPVQRDRIAGEERAARAAARAPFRAPAAAAVQISRLATRGETQIQELLAYLQSSGMAGRPDAVFGLYRVPDRISQALTTHSEKGRVVEWDVVHAPEATAVPITGASAVATSFSAGDQWVARRIGEPSVLDEDLGMAFLGTAGLGPERCFGLARYCEFRSIRDYNSEDHTPIMSLVRGLVAVHPDVGPGPFESLRAQAPLPLPAERGDVVVDALNWAEIAKAVRARIHRPPPVPSPFPYLPSTPQELLRSYLEVVGLQPQDCYSVQATVNRVRALEDGGFMTTNLGPKQPCADGKNRMRSHGCRLLVFVYRDTPEYAAGRERWARYEREVLQAQLRKGIALRETIVDPGDLSDIPRGLRTIVKAAETLDRIVEFDWGGEDLPPYRYCWPPVA